MRLKRAITSGCSKRFLASIIVFIFSLRSVGIAARKHDQYSPKDERQNSEGGQWKW